MAEQLQMIWIEKRGIPSLKQPIPAGYRLRNFRAGDEQAYIALMRCAGFETWNEDNLNAVLKAGVRISLNYQ
jgi:hypothetical protein